MSTGPITLFDKSFLQSLSIDESVWFDNFYLTVVCPIFYAETLADLSKEMKGDRSPEKEVQKIADKFPDMGGTPCIEHVNLCVGNMLGNKVTMDGRIMVPGGYPVLDGGKTGYVFDSFPEVEAFQRWQNGEFKFVEDHFAKFWRDSVQNLDLNRQAEVFRAVGIDSKSCKSLDQAYQLAKELLDKASHFDQMSLAVHFLDIPRKYHQPIMQQWQLRNYPPLSKYAPYAAYVLSIELFFQIAIASHLISTERPSNRIDISYLFYLPFCMVFVSNDKLHRKCAPFFLRNDQEFVWGNDLKTDLARINEKHSSLPQEIKDLGVLTFAHSPPKEGDFLTSRLWDSHLNPKWRSWEEVKSAMPGKSEKLVSKIKATTDAPPADPKKVDLENLQSMALKRSIRKNKGSWYQINKDIKNDES